MPDPGTLSEYIVVPIEGVYPKPSHLSWPEAAALPLAGLTAWRACHKHGRIDENSSVLITGIGGGVAQAALSFCLAKGAKVYVSSSSDQKIKDAITQGAKGGINYKDTDWTSQVKELVGRVDVVIDSSPIDELDKYLDFLNPGARIVIYGATANRKTQFNIGKFFLRHIQIIGSTMGSPRDFKKMIDFTKTHNLKPKIHKVFQFEDTIKAIEELEKGNQIGKVVIEISSQK